MSSFFVFALVVLIIALIVFIFCVINAYYSSRLKNGVALTSSQINTLTILNIIASLFLFGLFIYAIFVAVQANRIVAPTVPVAVAPQVIPAPVVPIAPVVPVSLPPGATFVRTLPEGMNLYRLDRQACLQAGQMIIQ